MNPIRYETIEANVAQADVNGAQVQVRWKCAATGQPVGQSTAQMVAVASTSGRVKASVQRSIASELIYGAARFAAGLLGGAAGRVVSNAVYTAANDANQRASAGADYDEAGRRAAIVAAFEAVRSSFDWDEKAQRFVAKAVVPPR